MTVVPFDVNNMIRATKAELSNYEQLILSVIPNWRIDTLQDVIAMQTCIVNIIRYVDVSHDSFFNHVYDLLRRLRNIYFTHC